MGQTRAWLRAVDADLPLSGPRVLRRESGGSGVLLPFRGA